ncbi:hypothetical protein GCM10008986_20510 [Salinibacillus aidingensis]|uniref:Uncharacterized protein n=1 Tax=Salinibacillus aidingensis TaxID=237684 RepID=A0ABN1BAW4_9BACI
MGLSNSKNRLQFKTEETDFWWIVPSSSYIKNKLGSIPVKNKDYGYVYEKMYIKNRG